MQQQIDFKNINNLAELKAISLKNQCIGKGSNGSVYPYQIVG